MEQRKESEQRLVCGTVKDLLPMYIEQLTSEESNQSIREHLSECETCRRALDEMRHPLAVETAPEIKDFKKYLKLSRLELVMRLIEIAAVIALITCFIVNLAVNRQLSWFYIVLMGLVTACAPAEAAMHTDKHRLETFLAALTICVPLLVGTVQCVMTVYMGYGEIWFFDKAVPIMAIWLVIVWMSVAANRVWHLNWLLSVGILTALSVPGNCLTNLIAGTYRGFEDYMFHFESNGLGNSVIAVLVLLAGVLWEKRNRRKNKR